MIVISQWHLGAANIKPGANHELLVVVSLE